MVEGDLGRRDLDVADLDELRRRVVDPVLAAMFAPGEVTFVRRSPDAPAGSWSPFHPADDGPWLELRVGDEGFSHPLAKAGFWLEDPEWVAAELADKLAEWICESSFGWGEWRGLPDDWAVPPPLPGRTVVTIHFADEAGLPLWASGAPAPWLAARLSAELIGDLLAWQTLGESLAEEAEDEGVAHIGVDPSRPPAGAFAAYFEYVSERDLAARDAEERQRAEMARARRRDWIGSLEPWRDELVGRLRTELGPDYHVPTPPRVR